MINKINFIPKVKQNFKRTALLGVLGAASLTASPIVYPPTGSLVNTTSNTQRNTYSYAHWKKDSINTAKQIKFHQASIDELQLCQSSNKNIDKKIEQHKAQIEKLQQNLDAKKQKIQNPKKSTIAKIIDIAEIACLFLALGVAITGLVENRRR